MASANSATTASVRDGNFARRRGRPRTCFTSAKISGLLHSSMMPCSASARHAPAGPLRRTAPWRKIMQSKTTRRRSREGSILVVTAQYSASRRGPTQTVPSILHPISRWPLPHSERPSEFHPGSEVRIDHGIQSRGRTLRTPSPLSEPSAPAAVRGRRGSQLRW